MQRLVNSVSNTYTVPPSGTVTLRIAHAGGSGVGEVRSEGYLRCGRPWLPLDLGGALKVVALGECAQLGPDGVALGWVPA